MSEVCENSICQQEQQCPPADEILNPLIAAENVCANGIQTYLDKKLVNPYTCDSLVMEKKISTADTRGWPELLDNIESNRQKFGHLSAMHGLTMKGFLLLFKARAERRPPKKEELALSYAMTEESLVKSAGLWKIINDEAINAADDRKASGEYQARVAKRMLSSVLVAYLGLKECIANPGHSVLFYPSSLREMGEIVQGSDRSQSHTSHTFEPGGQRRTFNIQFSENHPSLSSSKNIDLGAMGGFAYSETTGNFIPHQSINKIIKNLPLPGCDVSFKRKRFLDILSYQLQREVERIKPRPAIR